MICIKQVIPELIQDIKGTNRFGIYIVIKKGIIFPKYFGTTYVVYVDSNMEAEKTDSKYSVYAGSYYTGKEFIDFAKSEAGEMDAAIIRECLDTINCVVKNLNEDKPFKPGSKKIDQYLRSVKDNIDIITMPMDDNEALPKDVLYAVLKVTNQVVCNVREYLRSGDFSDHEQIVLPTDAILGNNIEKGL